MDRMIRSDRLKQIPKFPKNLHDCHERIDILEKDKRELLQLLADAKSELARVISYRIIKSSGPLPNPLELSIEATLSNLNTSPRSGSSCCHIQGEDTIEHCCNKNNRGTSLTADGSQDVSKSYLTKTSTVLDTGSFLELEKGLFLAPLIDDTL